ncbi:MAG: signal recognition particle-docking protein FtsY, partial [Alphaproteobacteria bacterium]
MFGRWFGKEREKETAVAEVTETVEVEKAKSDEASAAPLDAPAAAETSEALPHLATADTSLAPEPPAPTEPHASAPAEPKKSWFERLRSGLSRTSSQLVEGITNVFTKRKLDDATLEDLEDLLIQADLGVDTASRIIAKLSDGRYDKEIAPEEVSAILAEEVEKVLTPVAVPLTLDNTRTPHVILMVGVNGTGKTTTIGKLAKIYTAEGKRIMLAAGDTFRAAAIEQLKIWGERTNCPVISGAAGADAAGLAFDALSRATDEKRDVLIIDTAGRLQNKAHLMAELEKIIRVIRKVDPSAPHSVLLTLDATTGQNALNQVEIFKKTADVTGLIMTKLDGTARGGILVAIAAKFGLPVHAIGVGE